MNENKFNFHSVKKKRIQESNFKSLKQWFVFIKSKLLKYIQFQINLG